jgi:hypothetical protein
MAGRADMTNSNVVVNGKVQVLPRAGFTGLLTAVLARGSLFRFQARGFSMSPFIRDGDVLTLAPAPARLRFGDVAAFINPCNQQLSVHRLVRKDRRGYLMRGDNAPAPDGTILPAEILGRVIRVERLGRRVRSGLGPGRIGIALLSQRGWLASWLGFAARIQHFLFKRSMP